MVSANAALAAKIVATAMQASFTRAPFRHAAGVRAELGRGASMTRGVCRPPRLHQLGLCMRRRAIAYALLSAALFGASTPFAKLLVGSVAPLALAGLLYLGSGLGLSACPEVRKSKATKLPTRDLPWLAAAIVAGGIVGPALLMYGLART